MYRQRAALWSPPSNPAACAQYASGIRIVSTTSSTVLDRYRHITCHSLRTVAPNAIALSPMNGGLLPMGNGLTRLQTRYLGDAPGLAAVVEHSGTPLDAEAAERLGLVTFAPDDIDWADEVRISIEERASFSPDALTGLEANYRFAGPETLETKIFGRLSAWQNWIFYRPNASGPDGALRKFGTGQRAEFDRRRV